MASTPRESDASAECPTRHNDWSSVNYYAPFVAARQEDFDQPQAGWSPYSGGTGAAIPAFLLFQHLYGDAETAWTHLQRSTACRLQLHDTLTDANTHLIDLLMKDI